MLDEEQTYEYFKNFTEIDWYEWVIFASEPLNEKSLKDAANNFYEAGLDLGVKVMYDFVGILNTIKGLGGGVE